LTTAELNPAVSTAPSARVCIFENEHSVISTSAPPYAVRKEPELVSKPSNCQFLMITLDLSVSVLEAVVDPIVIFADRKLVKVEF
jgi:hypothetical protein